MQGTWHIVIHTKGICRGGLTPTFGSAHARNGRGFSKIEAVSGNFQRLNQFEQRNNKRALYPASGTTISLDRAPQGNYSSNKLKRYGTVSTRLYTTQDASIFGPCLFFLSFDLCSFVGGSVRFHYCSSKQRQSQLNMVFVTVIVAALACSLYFAYFLSGS